MKAFHQLATVQNILQTYPEDQPLHRFLAQFYKKNKQMGSKDRKLSSQLLYNYFRLGRALETASLQDRLLVAEFLCNAQKSSYVDYYKENWSIKIELPIVEKVKLVKEEYPDFDLKAIFPFTEYLSEDIDAEAFLYSQFTQPDLFVRVKRGCADQFKTELEKSEIGYRELTATTFAFKNGTKLDQLVKQHGIYEIQDLSSQKVGEFFKPQKWDKWWDCCAASGGKSLMLLDEQPNIKLLVSDLRESILDNLDERFSASGIKSYQRKQLDLTNNPAMFLHGYEFDGIIFDAPCSGSGTWGRTPEMIVQFETSKIKFYQELQRKIAHNIIPYLKSGKPLIYITCSVFRQENEEQVDWLCQTFGLVMEEQELIKGYGSKSDSMFVARLVHKNKEL